MGRSAGLKPDQTWPRFNSLFTTVTPSGSKPCAKKLFFAISRPIVWMIVSVAHFVMVDGSLVGLFYDNTTLAHQMPHASAVHHITVIPET